MAIGWRLQKSYKIMEGMAEMCMEQRDNTGEMVFDGGPFELDREWLNTISK